MTWDSFRQRVRYLRGEALSSWPASVTGVFLQAISGGVQVWFTGTDPTHNVRRPTLLFSAVPLSTTEAKDGNVVSVAVATARSIWNDRFSTIQAAGSPSLLTYLREAAVEQSLWHSCGGKLDVVMLADKGQRWVHGTMADTLMAVKECPVEQTPQMRQNDWYYTRSQGDGRFVAFSRDGNVVVYDGLVGRETVLTWARQSGVQYGVVEYAMEEELGRNTGIFWAPLSCNGSERLLCARVDERLVSDVGLPELPEDNMIDPTADLVHSPAGAFANSAYGWEHGCRVDQGSQELHSALADFQKYPRPGSRNAVTDWVVIEIAYDGDHGITSRRVRPLYRGTCLRRLFPWHEYVVRAGWLPASQGRPSDAVWFQLLDRAQKRTAIVRVPVNCFGDGTSEDVDPFEQLPAEEPHSSPLVHVLYEESQPEAWINLNQHCRFLSQDVPDGCVQFILASERTNKFNHLHLVTTELGSDVVGEGIGRSTTSITPITTGPWPVTDDAPLFIDEAQKVVYFSARNPNPLTTNLFSASYSADAQPTEHPQQLTMAGYTHSNFSFDSTGAYFYCQSSNVATPVRHCIYQTDTGRCLAVVEVAQARSASLITRSSINTTSTCDFRSISIDSFESDAFSDYLPDPLRMGGKQKLRRAARVEEFSIRRLTPSYVGQTVSRAVRSAIPFSLFQSLALGTIRSGINPQRLIDKVIAEVLSRDAGSPGVQVGQAPLSDTAVRVAKRPSTAPPLPPRPAETSVEELAAVDVAPRFMSLTNASRQFVTRETLVGTHEFAGMPAVNRGTDPLPRLFCFPVRTDAGGWDLLFGHVYLPPDFAAGQLYPVVVNAYGGPQCQLVTNAYPYPRHRRLAMLTRMTPEIVKPGTTPMFAPRGSSCQSSISDIDDRRVDSAESVGPSMEKSGVHSTVVVCVDGRGTPNRGLAYESAIGGRLGQLEVDDIASAVEYLLEYGLDALAPVDTPSPSWCQTTVSCSNSSRNVPRPPVFPAPASCADSLSDWDMAPLPGQRTGFVDRRRIAIHGWSYGGYVALRAIAKHPSLFKVCIAGAPVVRWDWYSAAYAERYLGVPAAGQTIYDRSSVVSVAGLLPRERNRVLVVHGWNDDNVHVTHTAELVRSLQQAWGRPDPIRLSIYANERHGLRLPSSNEHFETLLAYWLFHYL